MVLGHPEKVELWGEYVVKNDVVSIGERATPKITPFLGHEIKEEIFTDDFVADWTASGKVRLLAQFNVTPPVAVDIIIDEPISYCRRKIEEKSQCHWQLIAAQNESIRTLTCVSKHEHTGGSQYSLIVRSIFGKISMQATIGKLVEYWNREPYTRITILMENIGGDNVCVFCRTGYVYYNHYNEVHLWKDRVDDEAVPIFVIISKAIQSCPESLRNGKIQYNTTICAELLP